MPVYEIVSPSQPFESMQIIAPNPARILMVAQQLKCFDADITCDGNYVFSIRHGENGLWTIYQRPGSDREVVIPIFG